MKQPMYLTNSRQHAISSKAFTLSTLNQPLKHLMVCLIIISIHFATMMHAYAKPFGGGKNSGRQNSYAAQKYQQAPKNGSFNNQQNTQGNAPAQSNQMQQQAQQKNAAPASKFGMFGKILGGLALAAGFAWLASSLGISGDVMNILMLIIVAMLAYTCFGFIKRALLAKKQADLSKGLAPVGMSTSGLNPAPSAVNQSSTFSNTQASMLETFNQNNSQNNLQNNVQNPAVNIDAYATDPTAQQLLSSANMYFSQIQDYNQTANSLKLAACLTPEMYAEWQANQALEAPASQATTHLVQNVQHQLLDHQFKNGLHLASIVYTADLYENNWQASSANDNKQSDTTHIHEIWQFEKSQSVAGVHPDALDWQGWRLAGITQV